MSELGEIFSALKEQRRLKKVANLESSLEILNQEGFHFKQIGPVHFRLGDYDFWPTTGKYFDRVRGYRGRGVHRLLKNLKKVRGDS